MAGINPCLLLLAALLCQLALPGSAEEEGMMLLSPQPEEEAVVSSGLGDMLTLNRWTFAGNVLEDGSQSAEHWLVFFCVDWWQPCQVLHGEWMKLARRWEQQLNAGLASPTVRFAQVDCATEKPLCNEQGVRMYPHVGHYQRRRTGAAWSGGDSPATDKAGLNGFVEGRLGAYAQGNGTASAAAGAAGGSWTSTEVMNSAAAVAFALSVIGLQYVIVQGANLRAPESLQKPAAQLGSPAPPAPAQSALARSVPEGWARERGRIEL